MMLLCIRNLKIFQHGHPGYLGELQKATGLKDTTCSYQSYRLDLENDKKMSDIRLTLVKTV